MEQKSVKVQACRVAAQAIQVEYAEDAAVRQEVAPGVVLVYVQRNDVPVE